MEEANLQNLLDFKQPAFTGPYNAQVPNPQFVDGVCHADFADALPERSGDRGQRGDDLRLFVRRKQLHDQHRQRHGANYDQRFPTDGITYYNSHVRFRDVTDGTSHTVFMSETIRSVGSRYYAARRDDAGLSVSVHAQRIDGADAGHRAGHHDDRGALDRSDDQRHDRQSGPEPVWPKFTGWRGAGSTALRGRGTCWAAEGALNTQTNGYTTPNSAIPDLVMHHSRLLRAAQLAPGGANVLFGDGSVPHSAATRSMPRCIASAQPQRRRNRRTRYERHVDAAQYGKSWPDYRAVWRWHFYARLFCIPFVIVLATSGAIYLFKPQIEAWNDRPYDHLRSRTDRRPAPPTRFARRSARPGCDAQRLRVAAGRRFRGAGDRAQERRGDLRVYVHPETLQVLGTCRKTSGSCGSCFGCTANCCRATGDRWSSNWRRRGRSS